MRFIKEELAGNGKTRYCFALGKIEAELLYGVLERACRYFPNAFQLKPLSSRLNQMKNEIKRVLPEFKPDIRGE